MNISEHLKKQYWLRRVVPGSKPPLPLNSTYYVDTINYLEHDNVRKLTQEDFMREIESSAHSINDKFQSTRPIKELKPVLDADGNPVLNADGTPKKRLEIVKYDELETTRFGYQKRFAMAKTAHFAGDGWAVYNEQTNNSEQAHKRFDNLVSWLDVSGLNKEAFVEVVSSCFQSGDAALFIFATPSGSIDYKVYSYLDGYQIFPDVDENRQPKYFILYKLKGKKAVDVFSATSIETWVATTNNDINWFAKVKNWFKIKKSDAVMSDDGWLRVAYQETQIANGINQCVYFRIDDIPSGIAQLEIESLERAASFVAEGVKSATFDTLFIKAPDVKSLPAIGSHGSVIAVKGDLESLKASDAKRLAPSNISDVATINIKTKMDSILHSTMSVILDPDVLKSGADSSSAMRLCFNDEIRWCMNMQPKFYKPLKQVVEIVKALVAKIEGDGEYTKLRTSVGINIWVPTNFSEAVENVTKMKYAGILSAENSRHELNVNYPDDMKIIRDEVDKELYQKTFVPLKAKYEAEQQFGVADVADDIIVEDDEQNNPQKPTTSDNPYKPGVSNQATRRPDD